MKTRYKYIHFLRLDEYEWDVVNNRSDETLGFISWDSKWACPVFCSKGLDFIFNATCLDDISHFMKQLGESEKDDA